MRLDELADDVEPEAEAAVVRRRRAPELAEDLVEVTTVDPDALAAVLEALTAAGIVALSSTPPSLEELFLDAYRGQS